MFQYCRWPVAHIGPARPASPMFVAHRLWRTSTADALTLSADALTLSADALTFASDALTFASDALTRTL